MISYRWSQGSWLDTNRSILNMLGVFRLAFSCSVYYLCSTYYFHSTEQDTSRLWEFTSMSVLWALTSGRLVRQLLYKSHINPCWDSSSQPTLRLNNLEHFDLPDFLHPILQKTPLTTTPSSYWSSPPLIKSLLFNNSYPSTRLPILESPASPQLSSVFPRDTSFPYPLRRYELGFEKS